MTSLEECIDRFKKGRWECVQLRDQTLSHHHINGDDVDLLLSRDDFKQIMIEIYLWVKDGLCNVKVESTSHKKTRVYLYSIDGLMRVTIDFWFVLCQFPNNSCLQYSDLEKHLLPETSCSSIKRLDSEIELMILFNHLFYKKKGRITLKDKSRIDACLQSINKLSNNLLATIKSDVESKEVSNELLLYAFSTLRGSVTFSNESIACRMAYIYSQILSIPSKNIKLINLIGADGAGKTTIAKKLVQSHKLISSLYKGKSLYRKNYLYKIVSSLSRLFMFRDRDKIDENLSPLAFVIASLRLRWMSLFWRGERFRLLDRCIDDFIYLGRKLHNGGQFQHYQLDKLLGFKLPVIHLYVLPNVLHTRKKEMSSRAVEKYNYDMYMHFTQSFKANYCLINNTGNIDETIEAIKTISNF